MKLNRRQKIVVAGIKTKRKDQFTVRDINNIKECSHYSHKYILILIKKLIKEGIVESPSRGVYKIISLTKLNKVNTTIRKQEANTVKIKSEFSKVEGWKVNDLKKLGFRLISARIIGQGTPVGKKSQYIKLNKHILNLTKKRKLEIISKRRTLDVLESVTLDEKDFNKGRDFIVSEFETMTLKLDKMRVKCIETGNILTLRGKGGMSNRIMIVDKLNGKKHFLYKYEEIEFAAGELMEDSCVWNREWRDPSYACPPHDAPDPK